MFIIYIADWKNLITFTLLICTKPQKWYNCLDYYLDGDGAALPPPHFRPDPVGQDTSFHGHGRPPYTPIGKLTYFI